MDPIILVLLAGLAVPFVCLAVVPREKWGFAMKVTAVIIFLGLVLGLWAAAG